MCGGDHRLQMCPMLIFVSWRVGACQRQNIQNREPVTLQQFCCCKLKVCSGQEMKATVSLLNKSFIKENIYQTATCHNILWEEKVGKAALKCSPFLGFKKNVSKCRESCSKTDSPPLKNN